MTDLIVVALLAVVLGSAIRYMVKAKKSGARCIGCSAGSCSSSSCSCGCEDTAESSCCCHDK